MAGPGTADNLMTARVAVRLAGALTSSGRGIGRRAAQQLAHRELSRYMYGESVQTRILDWLGRLLSHLFRAGSSLPGGAWSTIALVITLGLVVGAVTYWIRPGRLGARRAGALMSGTLLSAADHRRLAERHAADGDYSAAIIERMRAVAAALEQRGLLSTQPGRTADELAAEAGHARPELATAFAAAASLFDDVRYGGRTGTKSGYEEVSLLDTSVQATRTASVDVPLAAAAALGGQR
jgi:hypothetical protein